MSLWIWRAMGVGNLEGVLLSESLAVHASARTFPAPVCRDPLGVIV